MRGILLAIGGCVAITGCGTETVTPPDDEDPDPATAMRYQVAVSADPPNSASVSGDGTYDEGESVTISAELAEGYRFLRWSESGAEISTSPAYTFLIDRDRSFVAEGALELRVTTRTRPTTGGTASGGGIFLAGQEATVRAETAPGHLFQGWEVDGVLISEELEHRFEVTDTVEVVALLPLDTERGKWAPGGTYSDWYFPDEGYGSLEWTFVTVEDPAESLAAKGLLHYYAYTFGVTNATGDVGGGYAGFQTNGIIFGQFRGKVVNYSIWGSNGGRSDGWVNAANTESGGFQIMYPYEWVEGGAYRFELREGPSGTDSEGKWWGLWVTDLASNETTFLGEQRVPDRIEGRDATRMRGQTAMFGEDLHWWRTLPGIEDFHCGDFEPSSMAAVDITADGGTVRPIRMESFTNAGQSYLNQANREQTNCAVTVRSVDDMGIQHSLGYWPEPPPELPDRSR